MIVAEARDSERAGDLVENWRSVHTTSGLENVTNRIIPDVHKLGAMHEERRIAAGTISARFCSENGRIDRVPAGMSRFVQQRHGISS